VRKLKQFVSGQPGWSDYMFRAPPKQPDARMVFLGGSGLITGLRGALAVWGPAPNGYLFDVLGRGFVVFWGSAWLLVGIICMAVAATGHRYPEWDRVAAFLLMTMWWLWGVIYLVSAIWPDSQDGRRGTDLLLGGVFIVTGSVLSAGVILSLRKTQEIQLREVAVSRIRQLEDDMVALAGENARLQHELDKKT
jgi:MFS family permease